LCVQRFGRIVQTRANRFCREVASPMRTLEVKSNLEFRSLCCKMKPTSTNNLASCFLHHSPQTDTVALLRLSGTFERAMSRVKTTEWIPDVAHDFRVAPDG